MKALILAAGLGTRLKPLTDSKPKALIEVMGMPMLERVILSLKSQGFNKLVVNVHYLAHQIISFLQNKDFGIKILISDESKELLDTGGGIIKASNILFKEDSEPFLIHNVDILSNADLNRLMDFASGNSGSTLLVSDRESSRKLIFDKDMTLRGWHDLKNEKYKPENLIIKEDDREKAFSGIYTMSYEAVEEMRKLMGEGKYSVMDYFLHPERKITIQGREQSNLKILDIGKPATLLQAPNLLKELKLGSN